MRRFPAVLVLAATFVASGARADAPSLDCELDLMCIVLSDGLHQCDKIEAINANVAADGTFSFERQSVPTKAVKGVGEEPGWTYLSSADSFGIVYRILGIELSMHDRALGIVQLLYDNEVRGEYSGRCDVSY